MSSELERQRELFLHCLDKDEDERAKILAQECADDADLRGRVERMLALHSDTAAEESGFLRLDAGDPERIGPYRILQRLGEGGMGIVYAAEQREPVRRRVAVKVLRHGHGSPEVLARFDAERQAMALMTHPNIARIIDAGTTADHRPYIVMEFVPGEPVTRYCERLSLPLRTRLELFADACDAVQHAHQRGVIHRDLKPSNILVMEEDGRALVKVIDFGIAKAISQRLTDHTLETKVGSLLGTPDYMSPEQAELSPLDVDTRADVYALGAVLYQLLTGSPPLELAGSGMGYAEMQQVIRERTPTTPSLRVEGSLRRQVRGELDWITLKALEKQPAHRYASTAALANDIRSHLAGRTVIAGPPSRWRKVHKFMRRHWLATSSVLMVILTLSISQVQLLQKNRELALERDRANHEAEIARQVTRFTAGLFELADPADSGTSEATARDLLDAGMARLEKEGENQSPALRAALYAAAGNAYHGLGMHEDAEKLLEKAVGLYRASPDADVAATVGAMTALAHSRQEHGDLPGAEQIEREALQLLDSQDLARETFRVRVALAETLRDQGRLDEAADILEPELASEQRQSFDAVDVGYALSLLGSIRGMQGLFEDAERLLLDAIEQQSSVDVGESENNLRISRSRLANVYVTLGRADEAESMLRKVVAAARQRYGDRHTEVATALNNLANALSEVPEKYSEAEQAYLESLAIRREKSGDTHPETLVVKSNLGWLYMAMGRWKEAHDYYGEVEDARRSQPGTNSVSIANATLGRARALTELQRAPEAEVLLRGVLAVFQRDLGERHWRTGTVHQAIGRALVGQGRFKDAVPEFELARTLLEEGLGTDHWRTLEAASDLQAALAAK